MASHVPKICIPLTYIHNYNYIKKTYIYIVHTVLVFAKGLYTYKPLP